MLLRDETGAGEVLSVREEDRFIGLAILLTWQDITHILYFAVQPELRCRGYGSRMLGLIRDLYPGQKIIADIERPGENLPNESQRENRTAFYLNNGYRFRPGFPAWHALLSFQSECLSDIRLYYSILLQNML